MKKYFTLTSLTVLLLSLSSCQAIGDIFKTGVGVGIAIVVVIIIVIALIFRGRSSNS